MHIPLTALAILRRLAVRPSFALLAMGTLVGGWLLHRALPFGLTTGRWHHLATSYELAFAVGAVAATWALIDAQRWEPALRAIGGPARLASSALAALVCATGIASCAIVPAHAMRTWQPIAFDMEASLLALLLGWSPLIALALALTEGLRGLPGPRRAAPLVALAASLTLPVVLPGPIAGLFDSGALLRATFDLSAEAALWRGPLWSTLLWGSLAVALASPARPGGASSLSHAVRNPR